MVDGQNINTTSGLLTSFAAAPLAGKRPRPRSQFNRKYSHLWFVLPGLAFFVVLVIYPTVLGFGISFTSWTGQGNDYSFIGLENFQNALTSFALYRAAWHNVIMFVAVLLFQHTVGLLFAVLLNSKPKFVQFYRTVLFLPVIISLVATGFVWTLLLSPNIGLINPVLKSIGLGFLAQPWLSSTTWAMPTVIVVQCWSALGWSVIIYLAGLQNIPEELLQAARVDGATRLQTFRRVTFPLLAPSFTALTVLTFIGQFRGFDIVFVLTGSIGSPNYTTDVIGTLIYRTAFGASGMSSNEQNMSYAIAMSVILFAVLAAASTFLIRVLRRREVVL